VEAQAHAILAVDFAHVELPVPRPRQTDMIRR
jgi:hypothetical protein